MWGQLANRVSGLLGSLRDTRNPRGGKERHEKLKKNCGAYVGKILITDKKKENGGKTSHIEDKGPLKEKSVAKRADASWRKNRRKGRIRKRWSATGCYQRGEWGFFVKSGTIARMRGVKKKFREEGQFSQAGGDT